jgi:hypothetical protein
MADKARLAARAGTRTYVSALRNPAPLATMSYVGRPRRSPRMTATQRNSQGRRSEWRLSPYAPKGGWR